MATLYNQIANQNRERLAALSDGVFAVAMTLLVLDLRVPAMEAIHSESDLWHALIKLSPRLLMYFMSFLTLGIFWNGQQTQLNYFERVNRDLSWIHLAFLVFITLLPFSTQLLAEFIHYRTALLVYWLNILVPGVSLYISWRYCGVAGAYPGRHATRYSQGDLQSGGDRAIALRLRRVAVRHQHLLEHRVHSDRADELRDRAAVEKQGSGIRVVALTPLPTLSQRMRKDGAPSFVPSLGEQQVLRLRARARFAQDDIIIWYRASLFVMY